MIIYDFDIIFFKTLSKIFKISFHFLIVMLKTGNFLTFRKLGLFPELQANSHCVRYNHTKKQTDSLSHKQSNVHKHLSSTRPAASTPIILNFQDTRSAYASKGTLELVRNKWVLWLCGSDLIVDNNEKLLKVCRTILPKKLFDSIMKLTFYGQFVGGIDVDDLRPKLAHMQEFGVKPILDYSVEADLKEDTCDEVTERLVTDSKFKRDGISASRDTHQAVARAYPYKGEESCEENLQIFLDCLETASEVCDNNAFCAIKVTGLGKPNALLESSQFLSGVKDVFMEFSEEFENAIPGYIYLPALPKDVLGPKTLLAQKRMTRASFVKLLSKAELTLSDDEISEMFNKMEPDANGRLKYYKFRQMCMPSIHSTSALYDLLTQTMLTPISEHHLEALDRVQERLFRLGDRAVQLDSKLLVDAEQTYFQPVIDYLANKLMNRYNQEKAVIFNTYQCYLKHTPSQLIYDAEKADALGYKFGAKLVRGAYMEQERERANQLQYEDPIYEDKALTNSCYHNMFEILLKQIENGKCEAMIASHNEFSIQYVVERMRQCNIDPATGGIYFGQLLGMCDQVTYLLGAGGYCSYKYVPYGPIEAVLPYLSRRAYENKGMLQGSKKEIDLLKGELKRRRYGFAR